MSYKEDFSLIRNSEFWGWSVWGFQANRGSSYPGKGESPFSFLQ